MLNKHNFEIAELAPQDEERLTMCGIYVTPDGTMETDGHQAVIVSHVETEQPNLFEGFADVTPAEAFTSFILDRESALKIAKAIPKRKPEQAESANQFAVVDALTEDSENAVVSVNDIFRQEILRAKKITGQFPDVTRAFPDPATAEVELAMNPDLLAAVLKTFVKFAKGHGISAVRVRYYGVSKALTIDAQGNGQTMSAAIMPMRAEALNGGK